MNVSPSNISLQIVKVTRDGLITVNFSESLVPQNKSRMAKALEITLIVNNPVERQDLLTFNVNYLSFNSSQLVFRMEFTAPSGFPRET